MNLSSSSVGWRGRVQSEGTFAISGKWGCSGGRQAGSQVGEPQHERLVNQKLPTGACPSKSTRFSSDRGIPGLAGNHVSGHRGNSLLL